MRPALLVGAMLLALLLAACGGDDDDGGGDDNAGSDSGNIWEADEIGDYPYPVQRFTNEAPSAEGRHFAQGEFPGYNTVQYGTDPPTSGRHIGELVQAGVYDQPLPNEVMVHQMEHGYPILWYNCSAEPALDESACNSLRSDLTAIVTAALSDEIRAVMTPDTTMTHRIALTSWQYMDTMPEVDEERIRTFIETFECHYDPEGGCT
jgi:hypothetical protein